MKIDTNKWAAYILAAILSIILVSILFCGCRNPHFGTHVQDSTRVVHRIDTFMVYAHDSVIMQMPCSDSIEIAYVDRWHTNTIYKNAAVHDTISTYRLDSVPFPVYIEKEVVRNSKTATFALWYMWTSFVLIAAGIALFIYRKIRRL